MSSHHVTPTLAETRVESVMGRGVISCGPETDLATVAQIMAEHNVHAVVVSGLERRPDGNEQLTWGLLTALDLAAAALPGVDASDAGALASTEIVTVDLAEPLDRAIQLMAEHQLSHLVVVAGAEPVGVLSTLDIARCLAVRPL
ncbi:MAG TPA: CBS domain-containing protein [Solirubrobacter sp.]|nr:CBS domain-containing protein [Solirubrobacter sp.]